jgi:hypothetical protein
MQLTTVFLHLDDGLLGHIASQKSPASCTRPGHFGEGQDKSIAITQQKARFQKERQRQAVLD